MAITVKYYYGTTLIGEGTVAPDYPVTTSEIPEGAQALKRELWVDGELKDSITVNIMVQESSTSYPAPECVSVNNLTQTGFDYNLECQDVTYNSPSQATVSNITEETFDYETN